MKQIEHYATYLEGGAGRAAKRIFDGIRQEVDAPDSPYSHTYGLEFLCREDQELDGEDTGHFQPSKSFLNYALARKLDSKSFKQSSVHYYRHLENRPSRFEAFSPARMFDPTSFDRSRKPVDLIHFHWVSHMIDYLTFFRSLPKTMQIVWTLHDMNAFTGGCHYNAGCERYKSGCGNCFQLDNPAANDLSAVSLQQKKKAYRRKHMTIVAPSRWLTNLAAESRIFPASTEFLTIHYGLDTQQFVPIEKKTAKAQLALDPTKTSLLFGAIDFNNQRKGIAYLIDALMNLPDPERFQLVVFGTGDLNDPMFKPLTERIPIKPLGFLDHVEEQRLAYSAADLFLLPSLEDNQPQTGLESLACGTPVVAFDTGGISEFVQHGKTGLLANVADADSLAKQISWISDHDKERVEMGRAGRELIVSEFEIEQQTKTYLALYDRLLSAQPAKMRSA